MTVMTWVRAAVWLALVLASSFTSLPAAQTTAASASPALAAQAVRSALFDAQAALLAGDKAGATAAVDAARDAAAPLAPRLTADPGAAPALRAGLDDAAAAANEMDAARLGVASGRVWAALLRGGYAETLAAINRSDAADAARWLLLRDFRPTTTLARPGADATLAVRQLAAGTMTPEQAATTVRGDLLDTYQARLEAGLRAVADAAPGRLTPAQAEALGLAAGSWPILAESYERQNGSEARARADALFNGLPASGDAASFQRAVADATAIVTGFRAAPLTEAEQARRAGQLLRYLSLVPVEYGRGVRDGQVVLDLEIEEARAFLDGARGAFADLRLSLQQQDPEAAREVDATLGRLDAALTATTQRTAIAPPETIEADANDASALLQKLFPPAWLRPGADADFDVVSSLLDQVEAAVAAGQYRQADASRLEAYAIFETGPEKRLLAFAPQHAQRVEQLFWEGDGQTRGLADLIATEGDLGAVRATRQALDASLADARERLGSGQIAPGAVMFNAATIVFREGLEAVLILASLLASMVGANRLYRRPLALGAGAALVVTAGLFFLAGRLLLSLSQYSEQVEAIVSLVAIGVLLLVMNWFFHKVYWTRWIAKHHDRRRRLLIGGAAGQALGLAMLGFTSVFREGAETVLFLQALVLDAGTWIVVQGVALGLAATAVVGVLTLALHRKLPHKKMLIVTGVMIGVVLVTMVGGATHTLQHVGWAPITPVRGLEDLPYGLGVWLGLYPTWQGLIAQCAAAVFVVGSYFVAERMQRRTRPAAQPARAAATA